MSWPCRFFEKMPDDPQVGDMWYAPGMIGAEYFDYYSAHILSDEYKRDWLGKRATIIVQLPSDPSPNYPAGYSYPFCVDSRANGLTGGWTVTGEVPNITVTPSIHCVGIWHGFITNGVIL